VKRRGMSAFLGVFLLLSAVGQPRPLAGQGARSRGPAVITVSVRDLGGSSRVTLSSTVPLPYSFEKRTGALQVTFTTPLTFRVRQSAFSGGFVKSVGWSQGDDAYAFTIELSSEAFSYRSSVREDPFELSVELGPAPVEAPPSVAVPTASGGADGRVRLRPGTSPPGSRPSLSIPVMAASRRAPKGSSAPSRRTSPWPSP
jgi:hypothetical protein